MKVLVLTSGGDCPGMNAFLAKLNKRIKNVVACEEGFLGLLNEAFSPLSNFNPEKYKNKAGSVIKSSRCPEFSTAKGMKKAINILKEHKIDSLIICGGNGSLKGAKELAESGINVLFTPGTIDNDISYTEYTLGFQTAVKECVYVVDNVMPSMEAFTRSCIFEVMGRDNSNIADSTFKNTRADLLLVDKVDVDLKKIVKTIQINLKEKKSTSIILRENLTSLSTLTKNLNELLKKDIVRYQIVGYTQRGGEPSEKDMKFANNLADCCVKLIKNNQMNQAIGESKGHICTTDLKDL